jgi:hypothetical protein
MSKSKRRRIRRVVVSSAIALTVVGTPLVAKSFEIGSLISIGENLFSTFSSGGSLSIGQILSLGSQVGSAFGVKIPNLGNLASLGQSGQGAVTGTNTGVSSGTSQINQEDLQTAVQAGTLAYDFFKGISQGNIKDSIINGLTGITGILDPQTAKNSISSQGAQGVQMPDGTKRKVPSTADAATPEQVVWIHQMAENEGLRTSNNIASIVLGPVGQENIKAQIQESALAMGMSQSSQADTAKLTESSGKVAGAVGKIAEQSAEVAKKCNSANASQDVLKCLVTQGALASQQTTGLSNQLAVQTASAFQISSQLVAIQAENKLQGSQLRSLQFIEAANLQTNGEIASITSQKLQYDQFQDELGSRTAQYSGASIFIPGLVPKGDSSAQAPTQ